MQATIDESEIQHFASYANEWWDENGCFRVLHKMNPVRLAFIKSWVGDLQGLDVLDVGCGGGLLCEPLARLGAKVTGIDACAENIAVAKAHAQNLNIDYRNVAAETLSKKYDVVFALEVIEHVNSPQAFLQTCCGLVKPGGLLFISTLNRTLKAYLLGVVLAEKVLKWAPIGTHDWKKFVRPSELRRWLPEDFAVKGTSGIDYSVINDEWQLVEEVDVNYIMCVRRGGVPRTRHHCTKKQAPSLKGACFGGQGTCSTGVY